VHLKRAPGPDDEEEEEPLGLKVLISHHCTFQKFQGRELWTS
jgi:hypothetical protein